jgi:hypothetical protein
MRGDAISAGDIKMDELKLLAINLQLFADDEDGDVDYDESEVDENLTDEDIEEEDDATIEPDAEDNEVEDEDPKHQLSDKEKAIIASKRQAKLSKFKDENLVLKQKLEALEQKERANEQAVRRQQIAEKLMERGYDEEYALSEADKHIENESIRETVKKLEFITENADIIAKYPEAKRNINKLLKLQKDTGWDMDKICRMEFDDADSSYDSKIKNEAAAQIKKKKRTVTPVGGQTPIQSIKLDPVDEKAYQFYAKKNPGVSRKQYNERLNSNNNQNIPHDKWD